MTKQPPEIQLCAFPNAMSMESSDPELWKAMTDEAHRQEQHIELIASENYTSPVVMQAQGSVMTNKYAEGYPAKRYYGGCEFVDVAEELAISRLKKLYNAEYANVQPHSGSQANQAVFFAYLKPGDTILGMSLADGGHLTHGASVNLSGKVFNAIQYGLRAEDETIDYDQVEKLALEHKPKMIIAGASAYSLEIDWGKFREIADKIDAYFLVDMAHYSGLIAAGVYPSPVGIADFVTSTTHKTLRGPRGGIILSQEEHAKKLNSLIFPGIQGGPLMHVIAAKAAAFGEALKPEFRVYQEQVKRNASQMAETLVNRGLRIVSGKTESHVILVDLRAKNITGKAAEELLGKAHITVNKNAVPNDPRSPFVTSGVRIGSPAITRRGFKEEECKLLTGWICDVLDDIDNEANITSVRQQVLTLCKRFPVYPKS
mgnify:CR=1 FL=1